MLHLRRQQVLAPSVPLGAPITTTTDDATVMVNVLKTNVANLDAAITPWYNQVQHTPPFDEFYTGWTNFKGQVAKLVHEWETTGFSYIAEKFNPFSDAQPGPFVKLAWNYYDNAKSYLDQNRQWRDKWVALSGRQPNTPDLETPGPGFFDSLNQQWVLAAGAAALLLILWKRR